MTDRDQKLVALARMVYTGEAREQEIISPNIVWHCARAQSRVGRISRE